MEDLKNFIDSRIKGSNKNYMVSKLREINKEFITKYKIQIKDLTIIPIETEIYYYNENQKDIFEDKMIHKNDLQKNNFGKLYFHRYSKKDKNDNSNTIKCLSPKTKWGGVDVCVSCSKDYYLSILIRSAFINGKTKADLFSGTRKICDKIKKHFNQQDKEKKELITFFRNLENYKIIQQQKKGEISTKHIFYQQRIISRDYSEKDSEYQELNCLNLGEYIPEENKYEYLSWIEQTFYTETKKQEIIKKYQKRSQTKNY